MIFKKLFGKTRIVKPEIEVKKNSSTGKIIEFIGPSGVGKSTLYNETKNSLSSVWRNSKSLNKFKGNTTDEQLAEIHWKLFKSKISNVDSINTDGLVKLSLMEHFQKMLSDNLKIIQQENEVGIFLEEGLCHSFSRELIVLTNAELINVLGNRFLIYVSPKDPNIVVRQIRKRAMEGGHTVYHHVGLDDQDLNRITKDSIDNFNKLTNHIEKLNVPVCRLFVEDGIEINSNRIIEFEKSLFS